MATVSAKYGFDDNCAGELQAQLTANDVADFVVETVNRSVDEVALEVISRWGSVSQGGITAR